MKDQTRLKLLVRQYDRERYVTSLNTYRTQRMLKAKLGTMVAKSDIHLARASGRCVGFCHVVHYAVRHAVFFRLFISGLQLLF